MDEQLFLKSLNENKGIILKIVNLYAYDSDDRKDLHQEIIYQAWKAFANFRGDAKFSTWLYRICLNVALTQFNKNKKYSSLTEADEVRAYELPAELSERSDQLYRAIRQLSEVDRGLIMLHLDGYTNADISEIIGITKNHASVKLHRIKLQLSEILTKK